MIHSASDTTPEVEGRYRAMLRARTPSERVVMACGMFDLARATVLASCSPNMDQGERRVHLFMRFYGADFDVDTASRIAERLRLAGQERAEP
jgi:hypothetical protein